MKMVLLMFTAVVFAMRTWRCDGFSVGCSSCRLRRLERISGMQAMQVSSRLPSSTLNTLQMDTSASNGDKGEPLTPEKIAAMIEVSFVEGAMQLAQGYVETLKLFIAAVLTAYGVTLPLDQLLDLVRECPDQSANRPLMEEEVDLRETWIELVYLTARDVQYRHSIVQDAALWTIHNDDEDGTLDIYKAMLPRLRKRHAEGDETGPRFNAQEIVSDNADIMGEVTKDPTQKALLLQNLRVIWTALTVIEEEKLANNKDPPAPPIPNKL